MNSVRMHAGTSGAAFVASLCCCLTPSSSSIVLVTVERHMVDKMSLLASKNIVDLRLLSTCDLHRSSGFANTVVKIVLSVEVGRELH